VPHIEIATCDPYGAFIETTTYVLCDALETGMHGVWCFLFTCRVVVVVVLVVSSISQLQALNRPCDRSHPHLHAYDIHRVGGRSVRLSVLAGRYPEPLCAAWAASVVSLARTPSSA
jgi:hypothetical protein